MPEPTITPEQPGPETPGPKKRRHPVARAGHAGAWLLLLALILAILAGIAALSLTERALTLPAWVTARIETRINASMTRGAVDLGRIGLFVDRRGVPRISLIDVALTDSDGTAVARLDRVQASFDPMALLERRIVPRRLTLSGAQVTLRRDAEGGFQLSFGQGETAFPGLAGVLDEMDALFAQGVYAGIERIVIDDLTIIVEDARSARVWTINGGDLTLTQTSEGIEIALAAEVFNGTDDLASAELSIISRRADSLAELSVKIDNVAAQDVALQSPALAVLGVLDAPISGALRATLAADGVLDELTGRLAIGAGSLLPRPDLAPVKFDSARAIFAYRPDLQKIEFSRIAVESDDLTASISGHAYLQDLDLRGVPGSLVTQLNFDLLRLAPLDLFASGVSFRQGAVDARLRLNPFTLDLGQVVLSEPDEESGLRSFAAQGRVSADRDGWNVALDLDVPEVPVGRALSLWPVPIAAKTRDWLAKNITSGVLYNVHGAFRRRPGERPEIGVTFAYRDATLQFLRDMPPLTGGAGYASLSAARFAIAVDKGTVMPEQGGEIDMAGSVLVVPDTRQKPARGEYALTSDSTLTALLSLLGNPPLRLLKDSLHGPDLAEARAKITTTLAMEFRKGLTPKDIDYDVAGELTGFRSGTLVQGRDLTAEALDIAVSPAGVVVSGAAMIDGVAVNGRWRQGLTPDDRGESQVRGQVALTADTLSRFGIALPRGMVSGRGTGDVTVDLATGQAPRVTVTSDLKGLGLRIDGVGWSKAPDTGGALTLRATMGKTPAVESLSVKAAGLDTAGRITLAPGVGLERATFDRVRLGGWLDAPVSLIGQGKGRPVAIRIAGGTLDFRNAKFGKDSGGSGGGAARGPVDIALDRLQVTEGIALTAFNGRLEPGRTTSGRFTARVNGGAAVQGDLVGGSRGVSLRLRAADAGGLLRSAGLIQNGHDGPFEAVLVPTGIPGTYDGTLKVGRFRLRGAPAIADLLGAISVVGLLEQLNGDGLVFEETQASFRLTPRQLILYQGSATGSSLGLSLDGVYDLATRQINMQGVISPIYLLNRIGSIFTRRGEGLFGFNFRLTGAAAKPAVSVNPLSILTPGMFREIFRRAPPER